jgi:hypothetical protein
VFAVDIFKAGATGVVGTNGHSVESPEPASLLMFGAGIGGFAALRRRRKKST